MSDDEKPPPPSSPRRREARRLARVVPAFGPRAGEDEPTKVPCPACRTGLVTVEVAAVVASALKKDPTP